ncbi:MAG: hypothetical protein SWE60_25490 [Thermodesulfobacteriota bacterium]|nr:hypothetical protein [Thermodesulfobacteriota bacterium]
MEQTGKRSNGMRRHRPLLPLFWVAVVSLVVGAAAPELVGQHDNVWADDAIPFADSEIFFELNATDNDLGVQFFLDGESWRRVKIVSPGGCTIMEVDVKGSAKVIGLTELFSESAEPSLEELPREAFLALFPEGVYAFYGRTVEGDCLVGQATLTHDIPAAPAILAPAEDEAVDPSQPVLIEWELAPDPGPPGSVIVAYQVIVEKDEDEERLRVFSVDVSSEATSVTVPPEFFELGKDYKVEVLAIETSGNKTISELSFETAD